jgi:uncharacterized protein YkwD
LLFTSACSGGDSESGDGDGDGDAASASGGDSSTSSGGDQGGPTGGEASSGGADSTPTQGAACGDGWGTDLIPGSLDLGLASDPEIAGVPGGTSDERAMFDQINVERENNGLPPLLWSEQIANAARSHAADMNQQDYFDHGSLTQTYRDEEGNVNRDNWLPHPRVDFIYPDHFSRAGENIASYPNPVEDVVEAWMNSDGHRAAILYDWATHGGIGLDGRMAVFSPALCAE